jgi:uncharacterized protein YwqG
MQKSSLSSGFVVLLQAEVHDSRNGDGCSTDGAWRPAGTLILGAAEAARVPSVSPCGTVASTFPLWTEADFMSNDPAGPRGVPTGLPDELRTPTSATASYAGGHPFVPAEVDLPWPTNAHGHPLAHLVQINFAELPPLPGFPTEGMLQWFCDSDGGNCYGLTFDGDRKGIDGMVARWWTAADLTRPAAAAPADPTPFGEGELETPLETLDPVALAFTAAVSLPSYNDELADVDDDYFAVLEEYEQDGESVTIGSRIGGHPDFVQGDPRAQHSDRAGTLLVQLDAEGDDDLVMWGDGGSGQLFGDPAALAAGDLSSLWWDWACH